MRACGTVWSWPKGPTRGSALTSCVPTAQSGPGLQAQHRAAPLTTHHDRQLATDKSHPPSRQPGVQHSGADPPRQAFNGSLAPAGKEVSGILSGAPCRQRDGHRGLRPATDGYESRQQPAHTNALTTATRKNPPGRPREPRTSRHGTSRSWVALSARLRRNRQF